MKHNVAIILLVILVISSISVFAETLIPLELGMPFGVIRSQTNDSIQVYDDIKEDSVVDVLPNGSIVQILAINAGRSRVYYFDNEGNQHIYYVSSTDVYQLTIAGVISAMSEPETAAYMQQFIGISLPIYTTNLQIISDNETDETTETVEPATANEHPVYVLNKNTRRYHLPSCGSINDINSNNFEPYYGTKEQAEAEGYIPCKRCNP